MKFLVDNQLPAALARFLEARGVECQHVADLNLGEASDAEIWDYANRVIERLWPKIEAALKTGDQVIEVR